MKLYLNGKEFGRLQDGKYHSYRDSVISEYGLEWEYVDPYRFGKLSKYRKGPCNKYEATMCAPNIFFSTEGTWVGR